MRKFKDLSVHGAVGIAVVAAIAALTLMPADSRIDQTPLACLICGPSGGADTLQNLLLFLPLGLVLAWNLRPLWQIAVAGLALSLLIESAQWFLIPGRDAALGDLITNTAGTALGWWVAAQLRVGRSSPRLRQRWALLALTVFLGQLLLTTWAVQFDPTGPTPWQLTLSPKVPGKQIYTGKVDRIVFAGEEQNLQIGASPVAVPVSTPDSGQPQMQLAFSWQPPHSNMMTPIARIDDNRGWPLMALDQRRLNVGVELRTRGHHLRLRPFTFVWSAPEQIEYGTEVTASLAIRNGRVGGTITTGVGSTSLSLPLGAQHGWALLNPFTPFHGKGSTWQLWTLAWLLGWGLLIGVLASGTSYPWRLLGVALMGLIALTTLSMTRANIFEILALALGWIAAVLSSRKYLRPPDAA